MPFSILPIVLTTLAISLTGAFADKPDKGKDGEGKGGARDASTIFAAIDTDNSGSITAQELGASKRFKDASKPEVGQAFKKKDLNGDGAISKPEFAKTFGKGDARPGGKGKRTKPGAEAGKPGEKGGKAGGKGGKKPGN